MGRTLGNKHYKDGKPIEIVDLAGGIIDLMQLLWDGNTLLLLCGCGTMEPTKEHPYGCHRRVICDALVEACSQVEMVTPEQIMAKEQTLDLHAKEKSNPPKILKCSCPAKISASNNFLEELPHLHIR